MGDAPAHFDYKDAAQAQVSVPVSLKGFATALDALIRLSGREHRRLLGEAGAAGRLRDALGI